MTARQAERKTLMTQVSGSLVCSIIQSTRLNFTLFTDNERVNRMSGHSRQNPKLVSAYGVFRQYNFPRVPITSRQMYDKNCLMSSWWIENLRQHAKDFPCHIWRMTTTNVTVIFRLQESPVRFKTYRLKLLVTVLRFHGSDPKKMEACPSTTMF